MIEFTWCEVPVARYVAAGVEYGVMELRWRQ